MSQFQIYLEEGFYHILDFDGVDHIIFIIAMMCVYQLKDWKKVLSIVTSFTIAHSITLALSVFGVLRISSSLIEVLIACTILFTCLENLFFDKLKKKRVIISGVFGLIHGLGFSILIKALVGRSKSIVEPLLGFNIGVEFGQIILVLGLFLVMFIAYKFLKMNQKMFIKIVSILIGIQSVVFIIQRV